MKFIVLILITSVTSSAVRAQQQTPNERVKEVAPIPLESVISNLDASNMGIKALTEQQKAAFEHFLAVFAQQIREQAISEAGSAIGRAQRISVASIATPIKDKDWISQIAKNGTILTSTGHIFAPNFGVGAVENWRAADSVYASGKGINIELLNLTRSEKIGVHKVEKLASTFFPEVGK